MRQAQQNGPQRVTVHGRDAVVVVRADVFDRMRRPVSGRDLVAALAASPLADVNFERVRTNRRCGRCACEDATCMLASMRCQSDRRRQRRKCSNHSGDLRGRQCNDALGSQRHAGLVDRPSMTAIDVSYSITSSARSRIGVGNSRPIALAVFRLTTVSNFEASSMGRSAARAPLRILPT